MEKVSDISDFKGILNFKRNIVPYIWANRHNFLFFQMTVNLIESFSFLNSFFLLYRNFSFLRQLFLLL